MIAISTSERLRITLRGAVQGVGFRPFVYRLAQELELAGWVRNTAAGVTVEVEGAPEALETFASRLERERPLPSLVVSSDSERMSVEGSTKFEIRASDEDESPSAAVLPDLATCPACREELLDSANRRFHYAFTNCTNCGPRYSIIRDIPYDRPNTTMTDFMQCPACTQEYRDPADRRFHAQPNACPACGPHLASTSITEAAAALRAGKIVAVKGIGGFQLLVDARNADAVSLLRERKQREEKPFALMLPSLDAARHHCEISSEEARLLESAAAPIVLLKPHGHTGIAENVAPNSPWLGVMLPYSPLHHLLLAECGLPLVATSGNHSDEPICIDNLEALTRLSGIATHFVLHNRPVARPCDDSVVRVARGRESILRRARGYAPMPIQVNRALPPVLAVGGHLKSTVAIAIGDQVYVSQHIGDLETMEARQAFTRAIDDLCHLYRFHPEAVVCDMHPDYFSTQWAQGSGLPVIPVQHHHAHAASCAAENGVEGPYLAVTWDGSGYGLDGTIWGGEFFLVDGGRFERVAHLKPFRLPGGEAAVREGWRVADSMRWEIYGDEAVQPGIAKMLERKINSPLTSSVGRLFDAVASLTGESSESRFEGESAMILEGCMTPSLRAYPLAGGDWRPLIRDISHDVHAGVPAGEIAARFHNSLVDWIVETADRFDVPQIVLSGGCFQNAYLLEHAAERLEAHGLTVYSHHKVPPNDGGLALGQAVLAGLGGN